MAKSHEKSMAESPWCQQISLSVLTVMYASFTWAVSIPCMAGDTSLGEDFTPPVHTGALHYATKAATIGFSPSLEMRENADFLLTPALLAQGTIADERLGAVFFDATIELNAPICRTYVVLFVRYWVSRDFYRVAVVWAEPHAGSVNFPTYPPTLNLVSDPNTFRISHQLVHTYDGVFAKPVGERGPFKDRFNVYRLSNIRFGEQEALDLRVRMNDMRRPADANGQDGAARPRSQTILLPERPITVAFTGEGPTITIGGQKRRYRELETIDLAGGRKLILDYQPIELRGRAVSLPQRIEVYTGDGKQLLRSARLFNCVPSEADAEQARQSAERFSQFDPNEVRCRDVLIKYWLKSRSELATEDIETLEQLRTRFAQRPAASTTPGRPCGKNSGRA